MSTYFAAPTTQGTGDGSSVANAMSGAKALGTGFTPTPGDTINFLGGVYAMPFAPLYSGTAGAPVTLQNNAGEMVLFDGSRNAASLLKRSGLDPWVDVASETGWASASYTSQPCTGAGAAVGGRVNEPGVFSKSLAGGVYGVWLDAPDAGMGTANVSGAYVTGWDMSGALSGWNGYPPNPLNDIHSFDSNHDLMANGYHLHEWQSQYILKSGTLYLRMYGPDANAANAYNPSSRKVYVAGGGNYGATFNGVHDLIVQDTGTDAFRIWRFYYCGRLTNASGITLKKIYFAFGKNGGVTHDSGCTNCSFDLCKVVAGGSLPNFNGYGFSANGCSGIKFTNGLVAWGGQEGVTFLSCNNSEFSTSIVRNAGGHGINWKSGNTSGNKCNGNTISHCGRPSECFLDKRVGHSGIEWGHSSNGQINYNLIYRCGNGLRLAGDSGSGACNNNDVSNNTVAFCDAGAAFRLEAAYDHTSTHWCSGNIGGNNVSMGNGPAAIGDSLETSLYQFSVQMAEASLNADMCGNRIQYTTLFHPSGNNVVLVQDLGSGSVSAGSVAGTLATAVAAYPTPFGTHCNQRDPLFTNAGADNYALAGGSPEIDAGSSAYPRTNARTFVGAAPDRGALESGAATITSPTCSINASATTITAGGTITFTGVVTLGTGGTPAITSYAWQFPGGSPSTGSVQNPPAVTFAAAGNYTIQFTVTDGNSRTATATKAITVNAAGPPSGTALLNPLAAQWASASSFDNTAPGNPAANAFDGSTSTQWLKDPTAALSDTSPATLTYDHAQGVSGAEKQFDRFDVNFYRSDVRTYDYAFFTSSDGQTWTNIAPGANVDGGGGIGQFRGTLNTVSSHSFPLAQGRYTQLRLYSQSQGTIVGGVVEWSIWGKAAAAATPGGTPYTWTSLADPVANAVGIFGTNKMLLGKDASALDPLSRWFYDSTLPCALIGDLGANQPVGRLRLFPYKAAQGVQYTVTVELQLAGSATWTMVASGIVTTAPGPYTDISFAQQNAQKVRLTFTAVNKGAQVGLWNLGVFNS